MERGTIIYESYVNLLVKKAFKTWDDSAYVLTGECFYTDTFVYVLFEHPSEHRGNIGIKYKRTSNDFLEAVGVFSTMPKVLTKFLNEGRV